MWVIIISVLRPEEGPLHSTRIHPDSGEIALHLSAEEHTSNVQSPTMFEVTEFGADVPQDEGLINATVRESGLQACTYAVPQDNGDANATVGADTATMRNSDQVPAGDVPRDDGPATATVEESGLQESSNGVPQDDVAATASVVGSRFKCCCGIFCAR